MTRLIGNELLTEKGNLKGDVTKGFKAQALEKIDLPLELTPNGEYAMVLGTSEDGKDFYLTVKLTVGSADPFVKRVAKEKPRAEAVEVPNIFD